MGTSIFLFACQLRILGAGLACSSMVWIASPATAQGRLDAKYEATLAGLPIATGTWSVDVAEDQYSLTLSGATAGLVKAIGGGQGSGGAQGKISAGHFVPSNYASSVFYGKKNETVRIALANGNVKSSSIEPEPPVNPDRIPLTDAHRRGVFDPMTGALLKVPGTADPISPIACQNSAIFDGRLRYDVRLEFKRIDAVKARKGYSGPVVVCAVSFTPIAGYVPDRPAIKYMATERNMEIWFAPIAGTRVLVPFKIVIPTPVGTGIVEAVEFVSAASPRTPKTN